MQLLGQLTEDEAHEWQHILELSSAADHMRQHLVNKMARRLQLPPGTRTRFMPLEGSDHEVEVYELEAGE